MNRSLRGALALALFASCAHAATLSATDSNSAYTQTAAAQPGDHVQLQSGTYALDLWSIRKTGEVVIEPAPGATVVATEINADGSSFLTFRGITVNMLATTQYGVDAQQATNIVFDGLTVKGPDCTTFSGVGAWFRGLPAGSNVVLKNSKLSCLGAGVGALDSDGLSILNNDIRAIQTDGMILTGVTNVLVRGNTGSNFHTAGGGHPDFIQWANSYDGVQSGNIIIDGNRFERMNGDLVQGIFGEDAKVVTITNNVLIGTMYHGISAARTQQLTIADNYVQPLLYTAANPPPGQGEADMGDWIMVRQEADAVTLTCNAAPSVIVGVAGEPQPTNVTQTGTVKTAAAAPGDYSGLAAFQASACYKAGGGSTASVPPPVIAPPVVTPTPVPAPTVNPLQATVDAQVAQIATLKAQLLAAQASASATQVKSLQNQLSVASAWIANVRKATATKSTP
jgi:hypothetical protein